MRILAYNPGHDGAAVLIENGHLRYALEGEKDDGPRHAVLGPTLFVRSLQIAEPPDVIALSGFHRPGMLEAQASNLPRDYVEAGYFDEGPGGKIATETLFAGRRIRRFSSSHIRSHIMCSYGLSPFPMGQPCYALIWEGRIGALYYIDEQVAVRKIGDILDQPGAKYHFLYVLADPAGWKNEEPAGKVMALAAHGRQGPPSAEQQQLIDSIFSLNIFSTAILSTSGKSKFRSSRFYDVGVESQDFKDIALQFSAALFDHFYRYASEHVRPGLPLLIAGGCGLNCDWNSQWRQCGLFSDVFVPPCANDSGVALGAAIDAMHHYTGNAKIEWTVYAGDSFIDDVTDSPDFDVSALDLSDVCRRLLDGQVIAWVQGRYEIGPRALGNRSLLAAPFSNKARDKLNQIKQRESYRPIAPICLEEDFGLHFEPGDPSPHMLYFQRVKSKELAAITHVDGSARAQSVNETENPQMHALLHEFKRQSGFSVLCNTSLNFKGHGFINRMSHLLLYAREHGVDGLVVGNRFWKFKHAASEARLNSQS